MSAFPSSASIFGSVGFVPVRPALAAKREHRVVSPFEYDAHGLPKLAQPFGANGGGVFVLVFPREGAVLLVRLRIEHSEDSCTR